MSIPVLSMRYVGDVKRTAGNSTTPNAWGIFVDNEDLPQIVGSFEDVLNDFNGIRQDLIKHSNSEEN